MNPKVYITRTGKPFKAFYDDDTYASNNFFSLQYTDYSINNRDNLMLVLALINSRLCQYFIRMFAAPRLGNAFVETKIIHLLKFPVPKVIDEKLKEKIVETVKSVIDAKKDNPDTCTEANEITIDKLVYLLYGLSYGDVKIVDCNTPITEEEYNKA